MASDKDFSPAEFGGLGVGRQVSADELRAWGRVQAEAPNEKASPPARDRDSTAAGRLQTLTELEQAARRFRLATEAAARAHVRAREFAASARLVIDEFDELARLAGVEQEEARNALLGVAK